MFQLYWEIQLLNAGMQPTPVDAPVRSSAHDCLYGAPELNPRERARKSPGLGCKDKLEVGGRSAAAVNQPIWLSAHVLFNAQTEKKELRAVTKAARKLKKAARHSWAKWAWTVMIILIRIEIRGRRKWASNKKIKTKWIKKINKTSSHPRHSKAASKFQKEWVTIVHRSASLLKSMKWFQSLIDEIVLVKFS